MNEPVQTTYLQGRSRALGPFYPSCERAEKKWFTSIYSRIGESDPFSGTGHHTVSCGSSCGCVTFVAQEDDGAESVVAISATVRGPPSLGLRARTKYVAQINGFVWGVPHTYESTAFGR